MSPGYPRLTTGIPVGKIMGMETCGSESLVITSLCGSGCMFWVMQLLAASTRETIIIYLLFYCILGTCNFFSLKYLLVSLFLKIAIKYIKYM
jgi:hypothetical protein